jgi:hypothetical protein
MESVIVYVPRCVQNGSEILGLKALEDFDIGIGGCPHSRVPLGKNKDEKSSSHQNLITITVSRQIYCISNIRGRQL